MEETETLQETEQQEESVPEKTGQETENYGAFEEHIQDLQNQAEEMTKEFPAFNLQQELCDPVFLQLTAPGTGISVADAYYALHRQEIQKAAAQQTREKVVSAIQSGARRPLEAGTDSQAPSLVSFRYDNATREQRETFKKELRRAWGRGETVYP